MGRVHYFLGRAHGAGQWFERALELYQFAGVADPVLKARVLGHRANLHYVAGQPIEAIAPYESAIEAAAPGLDMPAPAGLSEGLARAVRATRQHSRGVCDVQKGMR